MTRPTLSVVIPMYNEAENVGPMIAEVHTGLAEYGSPWELILVDDGSTDGTGKLLMAEAESYGTHVRVVRLQRNFGQTAAMQAGIDAARGELIATLDGDLQNDPHDIPAMVDKLIEDDLDLLSGVRAKRQDGAIMRKLPSKIANKLIGRVTGLSITDYGCSLKIYRSHVIKQVRLFGEMHRFIPAWASTITSPARINETPVNHRARVAGESKYGISRTFRVILDLLFVYFFLKFRARPSHFFGMVGLGMGAIATTILGYLLVIKLGGADIGTRPLFFTGILLLIFSIQFLTTGILAEMQSRTFFQANKGVNFTVIPDPQPEDIEWASTGQTKREVKQAT